MNRIYDSVNSYSQRRFSIPAGFNLACGEFLSRDSNGTVFEEVMAPQNRSITVAAQKEPSIIDLVPKFKEIESRLERTEQQLRLFQKISRLMVREMSLQEVLQGIVSLIVEFMECDSCLVYLLQDSELVLCASMTPHPSTIGKVRLRLDVGSPGTELEFAL